MALLTLNVKEGETIQLSPAKLITDKNQIVELLDNDLFQQGYYLTPANENYSSGFIEGEISIETDVSIIDVVINTYNSGPIIYYANGYMGEYVSLAGGSITGVQEGQVYLDLTDYQGAQSYFGFFGTPLIQINVLPAKLVKNDNPGSVTTIVANGTPTHLIDLNDKASIMDFIYPIGSVITTFETSYNPNDLFYGEWELVESGKFMQATDALDTVGTIIEPGLPNLTGAGGRWVSTNAGAIATGALYMSHGVNVNGYGSTGGYMHYGMTLDASKSNALYGKTTNTVQPKSIKCKMWKRIA